MKHKIRWTIIFTAGALLIAAVALTLGASASPAPLPVAASQPAGCAIATQAVSSARTTIQRMGAEILISSLGSISRNFTRAGQATQVSNPQVSSDLDLAAMYSSRLVVDATNPDTRDFATQLRGFQQAQQNVMADCTP